MDINFTIVRKRASPFVQVAVALFIGWVGMGVCRVAALPVGSEYFAAFVAVIFFTLINVVVSLAYESFLRYTVPSYYLYVLLVAILLLSAKFLSGISIWTQYEYRMMLISISIFYLLASTMVRAIRLIYEAAQKGL